MTDDDFTVKDSNGAVLVDGDAVTLIKDLPVKGTSITLKRGTMVKNIRLTHNAEEVECRVEKIKGLVLKTCFLKKVAS
ncbi:MAG: alkylphosphonate utilization protein [Rickettsiales bacterium]